MIDNEMRVRFKAIRENEGFARMCVASFIANCNPTIEELGDIKTAVSEAVTNSIVHAYPGKEGEVEICINIAKNNITIKVIDFGIGIENVEKAKQPFYTSKPELERSGMGFTVMEGFMDRVTVSSKVGIGTEVCMTKKLGEYRIAVGG